MPSSTLDANSQLLSAFLAGNESQQNEHGHQSGAEQASSLATAGQEAFARRRKPFTNSQTEVLGDLLDAHRDYLSVLASSRLRGKIAGRISPSDVVQDTLLAAHRNFASFRGESDRELKGWLRSILLHKLLNAVKRNFNLKRDARREVSMEPATCKDEPRTTLSQVAVCNQPTASGILVQREDRLHVAQILMKIDRDYRRVIFLRNRRGLGFREIGERMNRSPQAARLLWFRAIKKLRVLHEAEGGR